MREQAINPEKRYWMTHGLAMKEGEDLAREEYRMGNGEKSDVKDLRCQKVEGYGILETEKREREKRV